jgi:DNA repair protein RadC
MPGGIKQWPEDERPREKMRQRGVEALSDAELLAVILRTGDAASRRSALDLGRELLATFGSLRALGQASLAEICRVKGTGPAKAASIKAALELGRKLAADRLVIGSDRFTSPAQVSDHYQPVLRERRKEYFLTLLLDGKNRIMREVQVSEGSLNQSIVHPREVFNQAVRDSAAAIILLHNHPSGDPTPSREDREITRRLQEAGELLGIRVLDHIIIGDGCYLSFVEQGLL